MKQPAAPETPSQDDISRETKELLEKARALEQEVTPLLEEIATAYGGTLVGLENKVKSEKSLGRKILREWQTNPGCDLRHAASRVVDVLRYTMVFDDHLYSAAYNRVLDSLRARGYAVKRATNYWSRKWEHEPYRGINTVLAAPTRFHFELQLHTPCSWQTKQANHPLYQEARKCRNPVRLRRLVDRMLKRWKPVPVPAGAPDEEDS